MHSLPFRLVMAAGLFFLISCRVHRTGDNSRLSHAAEEFINDSLFTNAHLGISVFDPVKRDFLIDHQGDKYFIPASNTKIITCFVGMKYLGDSIPALEWKDVDSAIILRPTGDPTLLHPDYMDQPAIDLLRSLTKKMYMDTSAWQEHALGPGWSWDDYNDDYSAERSAFPVYGNVIRWHQARTKKEYPRDDSDTIDTFLFSEPDLNWQVDISPPSPDHVFRVRRDLSENRFLVSEGQETEAVIDVPFLTHGVRSAVELLADTVHRYIGVLKGKYPASDFTLVRSRPVDSMLKPMMHRSDNFFAEQTLLMVGSTITGEMNDKGGIHALLQQELSGFPDKPVWVDGSGLSRYNLFTPHDFIWLLNKMRQEVRWERITDVFSTGGFGNRGNDHPEDKDRIHAKSGSMSGVLCLSGFLVARSGRTLLFSILLNNYTRPIGPVRSRIQKLLYHLIEDN